jgi:hypothetical protein
VNVAHTAWSVHAAAVAFFVRKIFISIQSLYNSHLNRLRVLLVAVVSVVVSVVITVVVSVVVVTTGDVVPGNLYEIKSKDTKSYTVVSRSNPREIFIIQKFELYNP